VDLPESPNPLRDEGLFVEPYKHLKTLRLVDSLLSRKAAYTDRKKTSGFESNLKVNGRQRRHSTCCLRYQIPLSLLCLPGGVRSLLSEEGEEFDSEVDVHGR
jgi:hypothetical protein